jgi:LacI family transcriptional regulator
VPVTMRDVARKAKVSIRTVSRAINRQGEITEETRQRVLAAVKELGYRPSKVAQALVTRRTETIGFILGDITNPFFSEFARGVMDTAEVEGYNVFVCNSDGDSAKEIGALESLVDHGVDGIISFPDYASEDKLKAFAETDTPLVIVNRPFHHHKIGLVLTQIQQGAKLAVDYLVSKGHTAIAMLAGPGPMAQTQRVKGFRDALVSHGLQVVDEWVLPGPPVLEHGLRATRHLLTEYSQVTAVFCYNDLIAMGAIQACRKMGLRVPDDCAIVGFDDIQFASMTDPPLTSVHVDKYWLGQQAASLLFKMLDNPNSPFPPVYADVTLMVRASA